MTGVYIYKLKQFEEEIDDEEFKKYRNIAIILFIVTIAIYLKDYEDDQIRLFLDMSLEYSEILQSYADTLDELTNE